jgi:hypothetical protein
MPIAAFLSMLLKYGPTVVGYAVKYGPDGIKMYHQVHDWIASGKTEVTPDDMAQLLALANKSADDYLRDTK